jgi:hypothetical protein
VFRVSRALQGLRQLSVTKKYGKQLKKYLGMTIKQTSVADP